MNVLYSLFLMIRAPQSSTLFPYTTLFRSSRSEAPRHVPRPRARALRETDRDASPHKDRSRARVLAPRSEEHTSELQSRGHLVCRLLLEKKKVTNKYAFLQIIRSRFMNAGE